LPRKRRIDAPAALHHVWARGVLRRPIFANDRDRSKLQGLLAEVLGPSGTRAVAWAFMPNHIHLVLRTGETSISTTMRLVLSEYARHFNGRHDRFGHLFQGRFGSRLIVGDADFLTIIRYVHRNPIEAGLVSDVGALGRFPWSGHPTLMGYRPPCAFELPELVLGRFSEDVATARERLGSWMSASREEKDDPFELLFQTACKQRSVTTSDVLDGSRSRGCTDARTDTCQRAVRDLGMAQREVARRLGISEMAVSLALRREPPSKEGV
jgi:REP element-mobilizing transposase RayT